MHNESNMSFSWSSIFRMALGHKRNFILANLVSIMATLVYLPVPLIIPSLINEVLLKQPGFFTSCLAYFLPPPAITPALILISAFCLVLAIRFFEEFLRVVEGREFKLISKDIVFRIREYMLLRLGAISIREYETLGSGKLASYYIKDIDTIDEFLGATVRQALIAVFALLGITVVLLFINWKIALFVLLFNPFSLLLTAKFAVRLKELKARQNRAYELFQEAFAETVDAMMQIRADHQQRHFIQSLIGKARAVRNDSIAYEWKTETVGNVAGMVLFIGVDLYYILCMSLILWNELSIGMMIGLLQYVFQVQFYMKQLVGMQSAFYAADASLARINVAMRLETEPQYIAKENPFVQGREITIDVTDLHLSYSPKKPVLNGVNMRIEPHKRIGIVGPSGGGKSSLVQAFLGFYPADKGAIKINGIDAGDIGFDLIRQHTSTVLQHPVIFNDTVRNNLAGGAKLDDEAAWMALERAQLRHTVEAFDHKLDTQVGRRGVRLSGGQRQRLAIARMLLRDPEVVILDESTSALDLKTEQALYRAIDDFLVSRTAVIITHRLSTVMDADIIYVINNGRVAEEGTHAELMHRQGIYYSLFILQHGVTSRLSTI